MNFIKKIILVTTIFGISIFQEPAVFAPKSSVAKKLLLCLTIMIFPLEVGHSQNALNISIDDLLPRIPDSKTLKKYCDKDDWWDGTEIPEDSIAGLIKNRYLIVPFLSVKRDTKFENFAKERSRELGLKSLILSTNAKTYKIANLCPEDAFNAQFDYFPTGLYAQYNVIFHNKDNHKYLNGILHELGHIILGDNDIPSLSEFKEGNLFDFVNIFHYNTTKIIKKIEKALQKPNLSKKVYSLLKARLDLLKTCLANTTNCLSVEDRSKKVFLHPKIFFRNNETCFLEDRNQMVSFNHHREFLADAVAVIYSNKVETIEQMFGLMEGHLSLESDTHPSDNDRLSFMKQVHQFARDSFKS